MKQTVWHNRKLLQMKPACTFTCDDVIVKTEKSVGEFVRFLCYDHLHESCCRRKFLTYGRWTDWSSTGHMCLHTLTHTFVDWLAFEATSFFFWLQHRRALWNVRLIKILSSVTPSISGYVCTPPNIYSHWHYECCFRSVLKCRSNTATNTCSSLTMFS